MLVKQTEAGAQPVKVKVKVSARNASGSEFEHVYLPKELLFSWNGPAPTGTIPLKHVAAPKQLDLGPLNAGAEKSATYVIEALGDGEFELAASVDATQKGKKVPGLGKTIFKPSSQVLIFHAQQGAMARSQTFPKAIIAGSHYQIRVTLENRSYYRTLYIAPIHAKLAGNATDGHLQLADQPIAPLSSLAAVQDSTWVKLPPRSTKHEFDVVVRTGASDAFELANPDQTALEALLGHGAPGAKAPKHSGGTRSEASFKPPSVYSVAKRKLAHLSSSAVLMTGTDHFTLHVDDSAPPPAPEGYPGEAAVYYVGGLIHGIWNATAGTLYDFGATALHWAFVTAPTGALAYLNREVELWTVAENDPVLRQQLIDGVLNTALKVYAPFSGDPQLIQEVLGPDIHSLAEASVKLYRELDAAVYRRYTKVEQERCCGDWRQAYHDLGSEGGEQFTNLALALTPAVLARLPGVANKLAKTKTAFFKTVADKVNPIVDRIAPVKQVLFALEKYVKPGLKVTDSMAEAFAGLSKRQAEWLRAFTKRTGLKVSLRPRLVESLEWLAKGAIPKPFWLKLKNVNRIDQAYLGFSDSRDLASCVFNTKLPTREQVIKALKANGVKEKTPWGAENPYWTEVLKRQAQREKELKELLPEYRKWAKQGSKVQEWPYEQNVGPTARLPQGPNQEFGFQLRSSGPDGQFLSVEVNPRGPQPVNAQGWVRVTGDIDLVAVTHADGTPLSEVEYIAATEELRYGPLEISNPASASWQQDGKFDPKDFAAKRRELTNDGKCCLLTSDADAEIRMTSYDEHLSAWTNQLDYRVHLVGALEVPWHVAAFGVGLPLRNQP